MLWKNQFFFFYIHISYILSPTWLWISFFLYQYFCIKNFNLFLVAESIACVNINQLTYCFPIPVFWSQWRSTTNLCWFHFCECYFGFFFFWTPFISRRWDFDGWFNVYLLLHSSRVALGSFLPSLVLGHSQSYYDCWVDRILLMVRMNGSDWLWIRLALLLHNGRG
jgi:hypothetical protein